ncbi:MAG: R3H domain-containing nucleic acid-binding protein [Acidobacteriota bacterium]|nr:R3H domain-containing nucleic acid-binding protein [Acidobacteriota bacterium]
MSESRLFFTGNTLEQAVMSAARHYEVSPDLLAYEKIERKTGFLRQRRRVVIRVDPERPQLEEGGSNAAAVSDAPSEAESPAIAAAEPPESEVTESEAPVDTAEAGTEDPDQDHPDTAVEAVAEESVDPEPTAEVAPGEDATDADEEAATSQPEEREERPRGRRGRGRGRSRGREREPHSKVSQDDDVVLASDEDEDGDEAPREPLPVAEGAAAEAAADCAVQLAKLADLELEIEVYQGEEQLEVELSGTDQELLVRGEGRLLLSIQHLLPRLMQSELGEMSPCRVDSGGFRDRRVASLRRLAKRTADEVKRRHRPRTLRSMSPADRRTVHLALQEDEEVTTESAGDGFYKRITIRGSGGRGGHGG